MIKLKRFYAVHKGKPFFDELVEHDDFRPIIVLALEKDGNQSMA